jgi:hypothetical protein
MREFPGGRVTIEPYENLLLCDVMGVEPDPGGTAHPAFLFHLPLTGAGMTIARMLEDGQADSLEAVRAGEYHWELNGPLRVSVPYDVRGGYVSLERKQRRGGGAMDALTFRLTLTDPGGTIVATTHTTVLFLR